MRWMVDACSWGLKQPADRIERELAEAHATIAMLAQQLADKREIIRRLTT